MSEPDLDKIRFHLFFESLYKRWGLSNSEGTLEREKGLIQNQEESTKKHNTQILTKFWFLIYKILGFFHCKKKGRRWGQKKLVWKKCLSKSLQCFLSKPLEQFLADIPVTLILYLFFAPVQSELLLLIYLSKWRMTWDFPLCKRKTVHF